MNQNRNRDFNEYGLHSLKSVTNPSLIPREPTETSIIGNN